MLYAHEHIHVHVVQLCTMQELAYGLVLERGTEGSEIQRFVYQKWPPNRFTKFNFSSEVFVDSPGGGGGRGGVQGGGGGGGWPSSLPFPNQAQGCWHTLTHCAVRCGESTAQSSDFFPYLQYVAACYKS